MTEMEVINQFIKDFEKVFNKRLLVAYESSTDAVERLEIVINTMCEYTNLTKEQLFFKRRYMEVVCARRIIIGVASSFLQPGPLFRELGKHGYKYDRTTVYNDIEKYQKEKDTWIPLKYMLREFTVFYLQKLNGEPRIPTTVFEAIKFHRKNYDYTRFEQSLNDYLIDEYYDRPIPECDPTGVFGDTKKVA